MLFSNPVDRLSYVEAISCLSVKYRDFSAKSKAKSVNFLISEDNFFTVCDYFSPIIEFPVPLSHYLLILISIWYVLISRGDVNDVFNKRDHSVCWVAVASNSTDHSACRNDVVLMVSHAPIGRL